MKSVGDKLRTRTGLTDDGATLVNRALGGDAPMLAINARRTRSEQDEQRGFANLVIGTFGMFRNPTAHEARIRWEMSLEDAEDLLSLVSLIHRRLDAAVMPPRACRRGGIAGLAFTRGGTVRRHPCPSWQRLLRRRRDPSPLRMRPVALDYQIRGYRQARPHDP